MILINNHFSHTMSLVARVLLDRLDNNTSGSHLLSKRDLVSLTNIDRETIDLSFKQLQMEGVIRIERNRMIINKGLLRKTAGLI